MTDTTISLTDLTEPDAAAVRRSRRLTWAILALVLLADALDVIDATVTNIAAPTIARDLHGGQSLIKWVGSAYMLAMGALLVVGGRLGDKYGQRRLFLTGMAGFTAASAVAGLAPDPTVLIAARVAQGAFGALLIPQGMAIMVRAFSPEMLTKAMGLFGPVLSVSSVLGPVLAGVVIGGDVFGLAWRPIFLVNVILGVVGLLAATRILPQDDGDRATVVDGWGSGLLAAAMFGLLYGLIDGSTDGWSALPIGSGIAGLLFLIAFAQRQRTASDPLVKPSLLRNRGFSSGMLVGFAFFAGSSGLLYVLSLFLQDGLHTGPRHAAIALLPMTLGITAAAFAAMGGLLAKLGRNLIVIGLVAILAGCGWVLALVAHSGTDVGLLALAPALVVVGLGMGACGCALFSVALGGIEPEEAGSASGSISTVQQLAGAIGSAAVTSIFFGAGTSGLGHAMTISLIVILAVTAVSIPVVALMPRQAPQQPGH